MLSSTSSPQMKFSSYPPTLLNNSECIPILKPRGWYAVSALFPPLIPPVVRNEVIEKLIAFCRSVKSSEAASGPPNKVTSLWVSKKLSIDFKYPLGIIQSESKKIKKSALDNSAALFRASDTGKNSW